MTSDVSCIHGSSGSPSCIVIKRDYLRKWISAEVGSVLWRLPPESVMHIGASVCVTIYDSLRCMS